MLSREDFAGSLMSRLAEMYDVKTQSVTKPGVQYQALMLGEKSYEQQESEKMLYLSFDIDALYAHYRDDPNMERMVDQVCHDYENNRAVGLQSVNQFLNMSIEEIRKSVSERLIPYEGNEKYLEDVVHQRKYDLAVVYELRQATSSVALSHGLAESLGLTTDEIVQLAEKNRGKQNYRFNTLAEIFLEKCQDENDIEQQIMTEMLLSENAMQIYVITNQDCYHGAAALLDDQTLQRLSKRANGDLLIIPSSIHELLALRITDDMDFDYMNQVIRDVNNECVEPSDQLSNHAYIYRKNAHQLELVNEEQQQAKTFEIAR